MTLSVNDLVIVTPLNLTEKNRVREHGDVWAVEQPSSVLSPTECLCKSTKTGHRRWFLQSQVKVVS